MTDSAQVKQHPQASGASWTSFLKSIASFNGDLSSLTAPPFILSSKSLTEFSSYWAEHPQLLVAPSKEPNAEKRAVLVLRWFLSTLKQQYAARSEQYGNEKKPLNPFLGELFLGKWEEPTTGTTELVSEQVSHHPPATAYSITNLQSGVHLEGYNAQKASFTKTIVIKQIGHAVLTIPLADKTTETYLISLPNLHVEGLIFGSPFIELDGASYITSSSGYSAKVDYSGKGWLSGKKNSFTATLYRSGKEKETLYNVTGQWTKSFKIESTSKAAGHFAETYDAASHPTTPLQVAPVTSQQPLESRRAWSGVANGIAAGDMDSVGKEKSKIEGAQRALRNKEKSEGKLWQRRYFTIRTEPDPILAKLGQFVGVPAHGDAEKTGGVWRFDNAKAEQARAASLSPEQSSNFAREVLGQ